MGQQTRGVAIIDDHRSYAEALAIAIENYDGLHGVAVAACSEPGVQAVLGAGPDVVLVAADLQHRGGLELIKLIRRSQPTLPVLVMASDVDADSVGAMASLGVSALLQKEASISTILHALRTCLAGPMTVDAETLGILLRRHAPSRRGLAPALDVNLTPREREVLGLLADGIDATRIAGGLGISIHTARGHVKALLAKFGAHSQLELVVRATSLGLVEPSHRREARPAPSYASA